jgi:hypothetical protein
LRRIAWTVIRSGCSWSVPPGRGKTELIQPLSSLTDVHPTATLSEAALLSGSPKREKAKYATDGLLCSIGAEGIIVAKDFGSAISMQRDTQASALAALREIYIRSAAQGKVAGTQRATCWDTTQGRAYAGVALHGRN